MRERVNTYTVAVTIYGSPKFVIISIPIKYIIQFIMNFRHQKIVAHFSTDCSYKKWEKRTKIVMSGTKVDYEVGRLYNIITFLHKILGSG